MAEADIPGGRAYEDLVLSLLPEVGGRVERRVRTPDSRTEVQELWFPSRDAMLVVMSHPERLAARERLAGAAPTTDVYEVEVC